MRVTRKGSTASCHASGRHQPAESGLEGGLSTNPLASAIPSSAGPDDRQPGSVNGKAGRSGKLSEREPWSTGRFIHLQEWDVPPDPDTNPCISPRIF